MTYNIEIVPRLVLTDLVSCDYDIGAPVILGSEYAPTGGGGGGSSFMRACAEHHNGDTRGSVNTNIIRYDVGVMLDGITHNDATSATDGSIFTIESDGIYEMSIQFLISPTNGSNIAIKRNEGGTASNTDSLTDTVAPKTPTNNEVGSLTRSKFLPAGTVVWVHHNASSVIKPGQDDALNTITIVKVA